MCERERARGKEEFRALRSGLGKFGGRRRELLTVNWWRKGGPFLGATGSDNCVQSSIVWTNCEPLDLSRELGLFHELLLLDAAAHK